MLDPSHVRGSAWPARSRIPVHPAPGNRHPAPGRPGSPRPTAPTCPRVRHLAGRGTLRGGFGSAAESLAWGNSEAHRPRPAKVPSGAPVVAHQKTLKLEHDEQRRRVRSAHHDLLAGWQALSSRYVWPAPASSVDGGSIKSWGLFAFVSTVLARRGQRNRLLVRIAYKYVYRKSPQWGHTHDVGGVRLVPARKPTHHASPRPGSHVSLRVCVQDCQDCRNHGHSGSRKGLRVLCDAEEGAG